MQWYVCCVILNAHRKENKMKGMCTITRTATTNQYKNRYEVNMMIRKSVLCVRFGSLTHAHRKREGDGRLNECAHAKENEPKGTNPLTRTDRTREKESKRNYRQIVYLYISIFTMHNIHIQLSAVLCLS